MIRKFAYPMIAATLLAGCAAVPHIAPQVTQVAPQAVGLDAGPATIDAAWWTAFGDPQLDRLIAMGLDGNPSLDQALARVRRAEARVDVEHAGLLPHVKGSVQYNNAHVGSKLLPPPIGGSTANIGIAGASLGWDVDLFGRQHAAVRQAGASAAAARLDAAAARLTVSVSIAQTYVAIARAEKLIDVANDFVATRQSALGFTQSRIKNQLASRFNLDQALALLAEAEQARTQAVQQRDMMVHALAALVGRGADFYPQITRPTLALDRAPHLPELLPADLLGRRPDLLAGQARIDAAVQGRQVARKAFLPDINISALGGLAAIGLGNLFTGGSGSYAAGPALSVPIFEGGKLRADYRGATADLDDAVATYNDSVLGAVREAADAISNVRATDQDLTEEGRIVQGLRDTVRLDGVRTRTGLGSQLDAVESGFRLLEAEQNLVGLQSDALTRRIQLVAALGGGFDPHQPLTAASFSDKHS